MEHSDFQIVHDISLIARYVHSTLHIVYVRKID